MKQRHNNFIDIFQRWFVWASFTKMQHWPNFPIGQSVLGKQDCVQYEVISKKKVDNFPFCNANEFRISIFFALYNKIKQ